MEWRLRRVVLAAAVASHAKPHAQQQLARDLEVERAAMGRQHASCQPCTELSGSCLGFAVLKNNISLLEGLEFTPPSSARTKKGVIYVPGTYTNIFFLIFRLMRYADICFFSLSGVLFTRE